MKYLLVFKFLLVVSMFCSCQTREYPGKFSDEAPRIRQILRIDNPEVDKLEVLNCLKERLILSGNVYNSPYLDSTGTSIVLDIVELKDRSYLRLLRQPLKISITKAIADKQHSTFLSLQKLKADSLLSGLWQNNNLPQNCIGAATEYNLSKINELISERLEADFTHDSIGIAWTLRPVNKDVFAGRPSLTDWYFEEYSLNNSKKVIEEPIYECYAFSLSKEALKMDNKQISEVIAQENQLDSDAKSLLFKFDQEGTKLLEMISAEALKEDTQMLMMLDYKIFMAGSLMEELRGGNFVLSERFTSEVAQGLSHLFMLKQIPSTLSVVSEDVINPDH